MAVSASQLAGAIEPGSTEYGDRQVLESGLATAVPGNTGAGNPAVANVPPPVDAGGDPLSALLNGAVKAPQTEALTDGLSVGGGYTPGDSPDPYVERVRQVATQSKSPVVRAIARNELRRLAQEAV